MRRKIIKRHKLIGVVCLGLALASPILLTNCYLAVGHIFEIEVWQAAIAVNSMGASLITFFFPLFCFQAIGLRNISTSTILRQRFLRALIPSILVLAGSVLISLVTSYFFDPNSRGFQGRFLNFGISHTQWAMILLVPAAEELMFRKVLGGIFENFFSHAFAVYISALLFSFTHTLPTIDRIREGQVFLPLGPFFLGIVCHSLMRYSRSLVPSYFFHVSCNATPVVFSVVDPRWLGWLRIIYL